MLNIYRLALALHVSAGIVGLAAFWTPAIARKGGTIHVRAGRIFYKCTCIVALTGLVMALSLLVAPLAVKPPRAGVSPERAAAIATSIRLTAPFLLYLLLITFGPVYHGIRVLETRHDPARLRTRFHTLVNGSMIVGACAMIVLGLMSRQPVFVALSPIGFLAGFGNLGFARKPYASRMAWWYEHMGSMIGGGIAFHTAFLVLGAGRLSGVQLTGLTAVVPWIAPSIVGIPASAIWVRYYRRKFREDGRMQAATVAGHHAGV
jgi:hypothetical protein